MSASHRYRVELRQPRRIRQLATLAEAKPHFRTLDPFISRLVHDGQSGVLVLVDLQSGTVVARRHLAPLPEEGSATE